MKRILFLIAVLAPAAALIGFLWNDGGATTPALAQRVGDANPRPAPTSRPGIVSMAEGSGADLFLRRDDETPIAGALVKYPRTYAFARAWEHADDGGVLASDAVLVFNAAPKNEHDRARLLVIDTGNGSAAAGAALLAAFGTRSGIKSSRARIHGTSDLSTISRVDLSGGVEGTFVDPEVPGDAALLITESLTLSFEKNKLVAVRTDAPFTITRPQARDLDFSARGLEVLLATGVARIQSDIRIEAMVPERLGRSRDAIAFAAPGPIDIQLAKQADGRPPTLSLAGSRLVAGGGVTFAQGRLSGSGTQATAVFDATSKLASLELVGSARVRTDQGEAVGTRILVLPSDPAEFLRMDGSPVIVTFDPGASIVPAQLGDDVTLTTPGSVVVSPESAGADRERTITIGPKVVIAGTRGRVDAERIVARFTPADPDGLRRFRASFEAVRAHDPETDLDADSVNITRVRTQAGLDDVITIPGRFDLTVRPRTPRTDAGPPVPEPATTPTPSSIPAVGGGPMRLRGQGGLEITRPVLEERAITVVVSEKFWLYALERETDKPQATLEARRGRLVADIVRATKTPGAPGVREITTFVAEGRVRIDVPGRAAARGETFSYDARTRQVVLVGSDADGLARIERITPTTPDWLTAGTITFQMDLLRIVATKGVAAEMNMRPLPWIGVAPGGAHVPTRLVAQRLVASLDADKFAKGEVAPSEVLAEIAVRVTQQKRKLWADVARFDLTFRNGVIRGQPVRYEVLRDVDGVALSEGVTCPSLVMDGSDLLVEGPAEATLHNKPGSGGILPDLGEAARGAASRPVAATPEPVRIRCGGRTLIAETFVRADINVTIEQGDPRARGIVASGDSATLFLDKTPGAPKSDPGFVLAVLEGSARLRSKDFDAASDVMKLNRVKQRITLWSEPPRPVSVILDRQVIGSETQNRGSIIEIDYSKPGKPAVTVFDHDVVMKPDSRSAPR